MPKILGANLVVRRNFKIELRYFKRESSKFDNDGSVELGSIGFVKIGLEFMHMM